MITPPMETIPIGLCQCGCGSKTPIAIWSWKAKGIVKGQPRRFIQFHGLKGEAGKERRGNPKPAERVFLDALPFKIEGVYCKLVPLSGGRMYSIIDASDYPEISQIRWRAYWNPTIKGFYAIGSRFRCMHRFLLGLSKGDPRTGDHVDPSRPWDNRRKNIRIANFSQQQHNTRRRKDNSSGFKGVSWDAQRKKYVAQIKTNGKNRRLGFDKNPLVCAEMYRAAAEAEHGEFARSA